MPIYRHIEILVFTSSHFRSLHIESFSQNYIKPISKMKWQVHGSISANWSRSFTVTCSLNEFFEQAINNFRVLSERIGTARFDSFTLCSNTFALLSSNSCHKVCQLILFVCRPKIKLSCCVRKRVRSLKLSQLRAFRGCSWNSVNLWKM